MVGQMQRNKLVMEPAILKIRGEEK